MAVQRSEALIKGTDKHVTAESEKNRLTLKMPDTEKGPVSDVKYQCRWCENELTLYKNVATPHFKLKAKEDPTGTRCDYEGHSQCEVKRIKDQAEKGGGILSRLKISKPIFNDDEEESSKKRKERTAVTSKEDKERDDDKVGTGRSIRRLVSEIRARKDTVRDHPLIIPGVEGKTYKEVLQRVNFLLSKDRLEGCRVYYASLLNNTYEIHDDHMVVYFYNKANRGNKPLGHLKVVIDLSDHPDSQKLFLKKNLPIWMEKSEESRNQFYKKKDEGLNPELEELKQLYLFILATPDYESDVILSTDNYNAYYFTYDPVVQVSNLEDKYGIVRDHERKKKPHHFLTNVVAEAKRVSQEELMAHHPQPDTEEEAPEDLNEYANELPVEVESQTLEETNYLDDEQVDFNEKPTQEYENHIDDLPIKEYYQRVEAEPEREDEPVKPDAKLEGEETMQQVDSMLNNLKESMGASPVVNERISMYEKVKRRVRKLFR